MLQLDALIQEARTLTTGEAEVQRQMQICNACRYCEGFCGVFPAITRRLEFHRADVHFLANLCHNCGACLHACQYAPPHEFAINVPRAMASLRVQTYADYAWPAPLGVLYRRNGLVLAMALAAGLSLFLALAAGLHAGAQGIAPPGNFYQLFPHNLLVAIFVPVFAFVLVALGMGVRRFLRDITPATSGAAVDTAAALDASAKGLTLQYLDGGHGEGCNNADDAWTLSRKRAHHLTFYGFLLCFGATGVATLYHYLLGWAAPYDLPSLPKVLGVAGGVSMLVGTTGLAVLNLQRHPDHGDPEQKTMDLGFIGLLFLTSATGLALWVGRATAPMPWLLVGHLGTVMALFLTLPYGKFAHGIFRTAALLRHAVEKRQPSQLALGDD